MRPCPLLPNTAAAVTAVAEEEAVCTAEEAGAVASTVVEVEEASTVAAVMAVAPTADTAAPVAECMEAAAAPEERADTGRRHAVSVPEGAGLSKAGATPAAWLGSVERALPMATGTPLEALAAGTGAAEALAAVSAVTAVAVVTALAVATALALALALALV